ncbi:hypothetical protein EEL53_10125 [Muribaculaceae bacterium Isolate-114 (HZI)]|nr:hypothetical protein EEL53_10125 [Muribaculaceae bacterium Isolate-114 (HZI)]
MNAPLMKQYSEMKKKHPDAVLIFRLGDFYECLNEDAIVASSVLGITLTRRATGKDKCIELAGFPHHALDTYLPRLIRTGNRVAICEQLEDPKFNKATVNGSLNIYNPQKKNNVDLASFFSLLSAFCEVINQLFIFEKIRLKTQEIRCLASEIGISPRRAFEDCYEINPPSLYD